MTPPYERARFYGDIITTAVEGGTGYWAQVSQYQYEYSGEISVCVGERVGDEPRAVLNPIEPMPDRHCGSGLVVDAELVKRGLKAILDRTVKIHSTTLAAILIADAETDASEIDADAADAIVQAGLFGELVFG